MSTWARLAASIRRLSEHSNALFTAFSAATPKQPSLKYQNGAKENDQVR
jgi:hypothetical protein